MHDDPKNWGELLDLPAVWMCEPWRRRLMRYENVSAMLRDLDDPKVSADHYNSKWCFETLEARLWLAETFDWVGDRFTIEELNRLNYSEIIPRATSQRLRFTEEEIEEIIQRIRVMWQREKRV